MYYQIDLYEASECCLRESLSVAFSKHGFLRNSAYNGASRVFLILLFSISQILAVFAIIRLINHATSFYLFAERNNPVTSPQPIGMSKKLRLTTASGYGSARKKVAKKQLYGTTLMNESAKKDIAKNTAAVINLTDSYYVTLIRVKKKRQLWSKSIYFL